MTAVPRSCRSLQGEGHMEWKRFHPIPVHRFAITDGPVAPGP